MLGSVRVCWRLGRVVQMTPCRQMVDHVPLLLKLHLKFAPGRDPVANRISCSFARMAASLQTDEGREDFLDYLKDIQWRVSLSITIIVIIINTVVDIAGTAIYHRQHHHHRIINIMVIIDFLGIIKVITRNFTMGLWTSVFGLKEALSTLAPPVPQTIMAGCRDPPRRSPGWTRVWSRGIVDP